MSKISEYQSKYKELELIGRGNFGKFKKNKKSE